jgi:hypothetical protein
VKKLIKNVNDLVVIPAAARVAMAPSHLALLFFSII